MTSNLTKGDIVRSDKGSYRLLSDFTLAGLSMWTFAEMGGKEYFLKKFLYPTYPLDDAPVTPALKEKQRRECQKFETQQRALMDAVASAASGESGHLVVPRDFFRAGSRYYKVTDKVDVSGLTVPDIARLPPERRVLILTTAAYSIKILHDRHIVHGDLKPDNILIKQVEARYIALLIDFDDSYFSGIPPVAAETAGTPLYNSPELARYLAKDPTIGPTDVTLKSDVFALGLIFCQYLTGQLPLFDRSKFKNPCDAANQGQILRIQGTDIPTPLANLINTMMLLDPGRRPPILEIHKQFRDYLISKDPPPPPPPRIISTMNRGVGLSAAPAVETSPTTPSSASPTGPATEPIGTSRIRGTMPRPFVSTPADPSAELEHGDEPGSSSRIRGTLPGAKKKS